MPLDKAQILASMLDFDTMFCFLLLHVTRFPPNKAQYPGGGLVIDQRSNIIRITVYICRYKLFTGKPQTDNPFKVPQYP